MTRKVRSYTKEFKQEAVNLALKSPNVAQTARSLGVPVGSLHSWIDALKRKGVITHLPSDTVKDMATLIEENRRLQKELAIAKEEKEILKKAD